MLFRAGLRSLGYNITCLQGACVGLAIDAPRPAIHMLLLVELPEGKFLRMSASVLLLQPALSCLPRDRARNAS